MEDCGHKEKVKSRKAKTTNLHPNVCRVHLFFVLLLCMVTHSQLSGRAAARV